ncbi:hypothetical protein LVJ94_30330 [Pendulispora rubella]|uniref:Methyltransferase n=1 Tax=Pendulispora rubella TaxID=2741070 RepID=A0ABZ2KRR6_9BACT
MSTQHSVEQPDVALLELVAGVWLGPALYAVTSLGVADAIRNGSRHIEDIARTVGANSDALYRVMRALTASHVFEESAPRTFTNGSIGKLLESDTSGSMRALVLLPPQGGREMVHSVKTGESAFEHKHGMSLFDYLEKNPKSLKIHADAMNAMAGRFARAFLSAYDVAPFRTVVDVGGGQGAILREILQIHSRVRGILYDLPNAIAAATPKMHASGLAERCTCVPGNFFESVPAGGDLYLLSSVIHDWDDERAVRILKNCRSVLSDNQRLILLERIIPNEADERGGAASTMLLDLMLLVTSTGGRERTEDEFRALLARADLRLNRTISTDSLVHVIEAVAI